MWMVEYLENKESKLLNVISDQQFKRDTQMVIRTDPFLIHIVCALNQVYNEMDNVQTRLYPHLTRTGWYLRIPILRVKFPSLSLNIKKKTDDQCKQSLIIEDAGVGAESESLFLFGCGLFSFVTFYCKGGVLV